jgi:hypothetical protein
MNSTRSASTTRPSRSFSLQGLLVWLVMVSLGWGLLTEGVKRHNDWLFWLGINSLLCAALVGLVALHRCTRYGTLGVLLLLLVYIGSYVYLSAYGRYEAAVWGLDRVKSYGWAPQGFVEEREWKAAPMICFRPLHWLDERFWHPTVGPTYTGNLPINRP